MGRRTAVVTARNYWHETVTPTATPPLEGDRRCDVAIVGGGFTGLWTAYFLKLAEPSLEVVLVEAASIATGASGRNGGFATTLLDLSHRDLVHNFGADRAAAAHRAIIRSIDGIGTWAKEHAVDIDYEATGLLTVATNPQARRWLEADAEACEEMGTDVRFLESDDVRGLVDSPTYQCGFVEHAGALLNPAKLTHGLASAVRNIGVEMHELTPVTEVVVDRSPVINTPRGKVTCGQLVLATNAYTLGLGLLKRAIVPMYSYILVSQPLTEAQWETIGWVDRYGVEDKRHFIHYYRPTADGRILWGGHDTTYHARSAISPRFDANPAVFAASEAAFFETFPQLAGLRFTHRWGGPIAVSPDFLPMFGSLPGAPVHYGLGYSGHGVAPSHTGGQILADLVLGHQSENTDLLFVKPAKSAFPPEPFRWVGFEATRRSLVRQNEQMARGGGSRYAEPKVLKLLRRLGGPR